MTGGSSGVSPAAAEEQIPETDKGNAGREPAKDAANVQEGKADIHGGIVGGGGGDMDVGTENLASHKEKLSSHGEKGEIKRIATVDSEVKNGKDVVIADDDDVEMTGSEVSRFKFDMRMN